MTDWDFVYAQIIAATGWNWDQVDALTFPRYRALLRYWQDYPPAHLLLRALLGLKPPRRDGRASGATTAPAAFETLAAMAPSGTLNLGALGRR